MAIRIEQINIENLGPIQRKSIEFDNINLIYSKNEGGKSLLVEFIVRSLFSKKPNGAITENMGRAKSLFPESMAIPKTILPAVETNWTNISKKPSKVFRRL